jgi:hypothetical protein
MFRLSVLVLCLAGFVSAAYAEKDAAALRASFDDTEQLKQRLIAALFKATRPQESDHIASIVEILWWLQQDFEYPLRVAEVSSGFGLDEQQIRTLTEPEYATGIARHRPIERAEKSPADYAGRAFLLDALGFTGICSPSEERYNQRYIQFLEGQQWPELASGTQQVRYVLYLRMYKRGCISRELFEALTGKLVPALRESFSAQDLQAGDVGNVLYMFAVSQRFDEVPRHLLNRYLHAQRQDGSWPSTKVADAAVAAAHGAYIIAAILSSRGESISEEDLFRVGDTFPELPKPIDFSSSR